MTAFTDQHGVPLTAANQDAVRHFDRLITAYMGFSRDVGDHLKAALAADPDFVMAHCLRGCFFQLFCNPALDGRADKSLAAAEAAANKVGASRRERAHIAALGAWRKGDLHRAAAIWNDILIAHPRDAVALKLAHFLLFYLGDAAPFRDSMARVMPHWAESTPNYGFVQGMYAFALEEAGEYAAAEAAGRRAVDINPADIWAVHAVAHVMEMQGRQREGIDWIAGLESSWSQCNNLRFHVWWHQSLFHLEFAQYDEVLALYDSRIRDEKSDDYLDMSNAAALLWRLEDEGVGVGDRWAELAEKAGPRIDDHVFAFIDTHVMMALAAGGNAAGVQAMLASLRQASQGTGTEAAVLAETGVALCEAVAAYRGGDYGRVVELVAPIRYAVDKIGGSRAQRDIFARMLIEAALKDGRFDFARALIAERTDRKPASPWSWKAAARALDGLGDSSGADTARAHAAALMAA